MKRDLQHYPPYKIEKNGHVFLNGKQVPPEVRPGVYQSRLTVQIGDSWIPVEQLLSNTWYGGTLLVPRNGCVLNFDEQNIIPLSKWPRLYDISTEKILWTWACYEKHRTPVHRLAEATGLHHWTTEDFTKLITEILVAGIRK